jgi:hypothetical protein
MIYSNSYPQKPFSVSSATAIDLALAHRCRHSQGNEERGGRTRRKRVTEPTRMAKIETPRRTIMSADVSRRGGLALPHVKDFQLPVHMDVAL